MRMPLSYLPALLVATAALLPIAVLFGLAEATGDLLEARNLRLLTNTLLLMLFTTLGSILHYKLVAT